MTIAAATPTFVQSPGNGTATVFAFPFKIFQASDLVVGFITASGYVLQASGFTVQGVDVNGGGTITFAVAPPNGTTVDIRTVTPQIQNTEFANLGAFLPETHTEAFDRLTRTVQDLMRQAYTFGVHGPDQEGTAWTALPPAAQRANNVLGFDSNGLPTMATFVTQTLTQSLIGLFLWPRNQAEINASVTPTNPFWIYGDIRRYGAKIDGVTDDSSAWTQAMSCNTLVTVPSLSTASFLASGITIPSGVTVQGGGMLPNRNTTGCTLLFANSVAVCVTMTAGSNQTCALKGVSIVRATGAPPAGSVAIKVNQAWGCLIEDVFASNHARGIYLLAVTTAGISCRVTNFFTAGITENDFYLDSWPELRVTGGRSGANDGVANPASKNAYIYITATSPASPGIGPNTIVFDNYQFNDMTVAAYFLDFESVNENPGNQAFYEFTDCHMEGLTSAYIHAVGSTTQPLRVAFDNCNFNSVVAMYSLPATFVINEWSFVNNFISATMTLSGITGVNALLVTGNRISGAVSYTAAAGANWSVVHSGNLMEASVSITASGASAFNNALFADSYKFGNSFTLTVTGSNNITVANGGGGSITTWTPALAFGGANTGITYSTQTAAYQIVGNKVKAQFKITLTAVGSATGSATITGLPVPPNGGFFQTGAAGVVSTSANMALSTATPILLQPLPSGGACVVNLLQQGTATTAPLTNANFTATSSLSGSFEFFL